VLPAAPVWRHPAGGRVPEPHGVVVDVRAAEQTTQEQHPDEDHQPRTQHHPMPVRAETSKPIEKRVHQNPRGWHRPDAASGSLLLSSMRLPRRQPETQQPVESMIIAMWADVHRRDVRAEE
jgi:hypothetical protein